MELEENKITITTIRQYHKLLIDNTDAFSKLEFKTYKGWIIYSLSLVVLVCIPCVLILLITGLLSGVFSWSLLVGVSMIPFMFILPLTLMMTYIHNYRQPKKLRKYILQGLTTFQWDTLINEVEQTKFECYKENFLFRTEARHWQMKGHHGWVICMIVPFYIPLMIDNVEEYLINIEGYLKDRCIFVVERDIAYFTVPVKLFPMLDLKKNIEDLFYVFKRFNLQPATYYSPLEILNKVPSTIEICAKTVFDCKIDYKWIDWAKCMLDAGFVNDDMKFFAERIIGADQQNELRDQVVILIREFNLDISKSDMLINYILFLLREHQNGKIAVLDIIQSLNELYISSGLNQLVAFNQLHNAKIALVETGNQDFWTEHVLSQDNVDQYIINYLIALSKNEKPFSEII